MYTANKLTLEMESLISNIFLKYELLMGFTISKESVKLLEIASCLTRLSLLIVTIGLNRLHTVRQSSISGDSVGITVGGAVGTAEGTILGELLGTSVGTTVGYMEGRGVGLSESAVTKSRRQRK